MMKQWFLRVFCGVAGMALITFFASCDGHSWEKTHVLFEEHGSHGGEEGGHDEHSDHSGHEEHADHAEHGGEAHGEEAHGEKAPAH